MKLCVLVVSFPDPPPKRKGVLKEGGGGSGDETSVEGGSGDETSVEGGGGLGTRLVHSTLFIRKYSHITLPIDQHQNHTHQQ